MERFKVIRGDELIENDYGDTKVSNIVSTGEVSVVKVKKIGDEIQSGYDSESDVVYYVLEGEGYAVVERKKVFLKKGDCVSYTKGVSYKHLKGLTLLAIATPPFDRDKRVYTE